MITKIKSKRLKSWKKENMINSMLNGKATIVLSVVGLIKKTCFSKWISSGTEIFKRKSES